MYNFKFNDFDFSVSNEIYDLNIHDDAENDHVIVVDFSLKKDFEEDKNEYLNIHQMIFSTKDMFESILKIFFGFEDRIVKEILNEIEVIQLE